jgi:hypothetical protein
VDYPFEKENKKIKAFAYSLENLDLSSEGNYVISTGRQIPGGTKSFSSCTSIQPMLFELLRFDFLTLKTRVQAIEGFYYIKYFSEFDLNN